MVSTKMPGTSGCTPNHLQVLRCTSGYAKCNASILDTIVYILEGSVMWLSLSTSMQNDLKLDH